MMKQLNAAFEMIAVDGNRAYFLDNTDEDCSSVFESFETQSGVSLTDLECAARMKTKVFAPTDGRHYTVGRIQTVAERRADGKL